MGQALSDGTGIEGAAKAPPERSASEKRRLKLVLLCIGAVVAIAGTIVSEVWKARLEESRERAQAAYATLQTLQTQGYELVQLARHDAQTSFVLAGDSNFVPEFQYYARYYAWNAANNIKLFLAGRATKAATPASTSAGASQDSAPSCTLPSPPSNRYAPVPKNAAPQTMSFLQTLADPWKCYNAQLSVAMDQDEEEIRTYSKRLGLASSLATMAQLLGIGIAFGKDLID